jgi:hypothetical protein
MGIGQAIAQVLWDYGFLTLLLPFALVFTIVYGLLKRAQLFGTTETSHKVNLVLAFSLALTGVVVFTQTGFLTIFTHWATLLVLGALLLYVLLSVGGAGIGNLLGIILFVLVLVITALWALIGYAGVTIDERWVFVPLALIIFVAAVYYILRPGNRTAPAQPAQGATPP